MNPAAFALAAFLAVMVGCQGSPTALPNERPEAAGAESPQDGVPNPAGPTMRVSLPVDDGSVDGISVLTWAIDDNPSVIAAFFDAHDPADLPADVKANLSKNGLAIAQTTLAALPDALAALGGTSASVSSWLGQATQWHRVAGANLSAPSACIVSGTTRRLAPGALQLLLRGWTVPLEDGAVVDLELLSVHIPGGPIPGARRTSTETFPAAGFFTSVPRGAVFLITSVTPRAKGSSSRGPSAGPPVEVPPTLGELLLPPNEDETLASSRRPILVVIPLMSSGHFASEPRIDSASSPP